MHAFLLLACGVALNTCLTVCAAVSVLLLLDPAQKSRDHVLDSWRPQNQLGIQIGTSTDCSCQRRAIAYRCTDLQVKLLIW